MRFYFYIVCLVGCALFQSQVNAAVDLIPRNCAEEIPKIRGWMNVEVILNGYKKRVPSLGIQMTHLDVDLTIKEVANRALALLKKDFNVHQALRNYSSDRVIMYLNNSPIEVVCKEHWNQPITLCFLLRKELHILN